MTRLLRPLVQTGPVRPDGALPLAGGWTWFTHAEVLGGDIISADALTDAEVARLTAPRASLAGLTWDQPRIMAILNVTPDSFSDGGVFNAPERAINRAQSLVGEGADILDIGGESTRPGADFVPAGDEIVRTAPVISSVAPQISAPISIDTRKASVAEAALAAGAAMLNDVSALTYDADMARVAATSGAPICLMHAQGDPKTMQSDPHYVDVLAEVYDHLEAQIAVAEAAGVSRSQIIVDPGIGFGKTLHHNLAILQRISLFHSLGGVVLLGASRKRFIGTISGTEDAAARMPGSLAVAQSAVAQGVQILRVHDMLATKQALALDRAIREGRHDT